MQNMKSTMNLRPSLLMLALVAAESMEVCLSVCPSDIIVH